VFLSANTSQGILHNMREFTLTELHHLAQLALATTKISMLERKY
jgi:hypothetical protein